MRLIDANALLENLPVVEKDKQISLIGAVADMVVLISNAPTIDAAPVVHSCWEEYGNTIVCKACGEKWSIREGGDFVIIEAKGDLKFCPSCGAKMDVKM